MNAALVGVVIGGVIAAGAQVVAALLQDRLASRREGREVRRRSYVAMVEVCTEIVAEATERERHARRGSADLEGLADRASNQYAAVLMVGPADVASAVDELQTALYRLCSEGWSNERVRHAGSALGLFLVAARQDLGIADLGNVTVLGTEPKDPEV